MPQFTEAVCDRLYMPSSTGGSHSLWGNDVCASWSLASELLSILHTLGLQQWMRICHINLNMEEFLLSQQVNMILQAFYYLTVSDVYTNNCSVVWEYINKKLHIKIGLQFKFVLSCFWEETNPWVLLQIKCTRLPAWRATHLTKAKEFHYCSFKFSDQIFNTKF